MCLTSSPEDSDDLSLGTPKPPTEGCREATGHLRFILEPCACMRVAWCVHVSTCAHDGDPGALSYFPSAGHAPNTLLTTTHLLSR